MDMQTLQQLIGSFGFPIFMCVLMAWYINNTHKQLIDAMYALNRTMQAVLTKLDIIDDEERKNNENNSI